MKIDWNSIDTVLLDMDGTILDRHFDDYFWLEHVPGRWASRNGVSLEYAKEYLYAMFRSQEKTLNWTDLDYWSSRLELDIPMLKKEVEHLIAVHPHVVEFLMFLKHGGKNAWLVTNAHHKTLDLKMKKTLLTPYFTGIVSAHQVGLPKEDYNFWGALQKFISYDPARTLLGEDSETNLETARRFGIRHLVYISRYSSAIKPLPSFTYPSINYFSQLIPSHGGSAVLKLEHELTAIR